MKVDNPVEFTLDFEGRKSFEIFKKYNGQVIVCPKVDITVRKIGYQLVTEIRGSIVQSNLIMSDTELSGTIELKKGIKYPFDIFLYNDKCPSYKGKNVSFLFKIVPYILLKKEDVKKATFVSLFTGRDDGVRKEEKFISFVSAPNIYQVQSNKIKLVQYVFRNVIFAVISLTFILGTLFFFFMNEPNFFEIHYQKIILLGSTLLLLFTTYFIIGKVFIGNIDTKIHLLESGLMEVSLKSKWELVRSISISYIVQEEVKDERGTSSSVYTTKFDESPINLIKRPFGTVTTTFEYPEQTMPSIEFGDAKIFWSLVINVKTSFLLPFSYRGIFEVGRK